MKPVPHDDFARKKTLTSLLYTIVGIKPACKFSKEELSLCTPLLNDLISSSPSLFSVCQMGNTFYLINEQPMELLHPKKYVANFPEGEKSIYQGFVRCASLADKEQANKLLGNGPDYVPAKGAARHAVLD